MARIALVSDITPVPVPPGHMVLHRHFVRLRNHAILVVSGTIPEPDPQDCHWEVVRIPRKLRWLQRPDTYPAFEEIRSHQILRAIRERVNRFKPDVIMSVWWPEFLLPAARLADELCVPLVLICHDDLQHMLSRSPHVRLWARLRLGTIYRAAAARLCVSESMCEIFEQRYRAPAALMYPMPEDSAHHGGELATGPITRRDSSVRIGFFGNLGGGNAAVLLSVADALAELGGTLHFASTEIGRIRDLVRSHPSIVDCGVFASPSALLAYFRESVDAMLIPQSFDRAYANRVAAQFPSKLTEAAQLGLPLMIVAPPHASAARWSAVHQGASLLCTQLTPAAIGATLRTLSDPRRRSELTRGAAEVAAQLFDPAKIHQVLEDAVARVTTNRRTA
jgi:glycosyltransferase involved in cell wall biosynthesis